MALPAFDTLKLAQRMEAAGMSPPQAAGFAEALSEGMTSELATKSDLGELRAWAQSEFAAVRAEIMASKNETIRWVIGLFVGIEMLLSGVSWLMLGLAVRNTARSILPV